MLFQAMVSGVVRDPATLDYMGMAEAGRVESYGSLGFGAWVFGAWGDLSGRGGSVKFGGHSKQDLRRGSGSSVQLPLLLDSLGRDLGTSCRDSMGRSIMPDCRQGVLVIAEKAPWG